MQVSGDRPGARTLTALRAHRARRGAPSLALARDDAHVLGRVDGGLRHPERLSRAFTRPLTSAAHQLGEAMPPAVRLNDLRHTQPTLHLRAGVHPKIVSQRPGHATISITLDVHRHALPTLQREALVYGA